ncbi:MAG TPA: cupin domain-containing protein [Myxococcaceae bacterium]|nr:cupin domain-containing protein [Myxococcaceae bacterium]
MHPHDLKPILDGISDEGMSLSRGDPSRIFGQLNQCLLGAVRFSGQPPWERHPDGDELLHVLDGELVLCVLAPEGRVEVTLHAGSVFVIPRGLWHRSYARGAVSMLFATPTKNGEISLADDPRC